MRSATPVRTTAATQSPRTTVSLDGVRRQDDEEEEEEEKRPSRTFREDHVKLELEVELVVVVVVEAEVAEGAPYDGRPKSVVVVSGGRLCAARG